MISRARSRKKDQHQNYLVMNVAKFVTRAPLASTTMSYHVKHARLVTSSIFAIQRWSNHIMLLGCAFFETIRP